MLVVSVYNMAYNVECVKKYNEKHANMGNNDNIKGTCSENTSKIIQYPLRINEDFINYGNF